jgi:SSS family solute:Na+ symporter
VTTNPVVIFAALLYFAVILGIGYVTRKASADPMDYYVAGRKIGPFVNGAALAAAYFSPASFLGMPAFIFIMGYPFWWVLSSIIAGLPLASMMTAAPMRKYAPVSFTDYYADRYDSPKVMRVLAGIPTLMSGWAYIVLSTVGTALFMTAILRVSYPVAVVIAAVVIMFYVFMGGMVATTFSSAFQGVLMTFASVVVAFVVLNVFGGFSGLANAVYANNANFWLMPGASPEGLFSHPIMGYWTGVVGFYFVWHFGFSTMPYTVVRFFTAMDIKSARRSVFWAVLFGGAMYWGLLIAGTAARVILETMHPMMQQGATNAVGVLNMIRTQLAIPGAPITDYSYIALVEALGNPVILGILVAGGLAISMATAAAWVMVLNVLIGRDFMGKCLGNVWSINNPVKSLRVWTVVILIITTMFSFNPLGLVLDLSGWAFLVVIVTTGVPLVGGIWWRRANTTAAMATIIVFFPLSMYSWLYARNTLGSPHWAAFSRLIYGSHEGAFKLPTGHQVWLIPVSVIFFVVVSLLTKPNSDEVLQKYCDDIQ